MKNITVPYNKKKRLENIRDKTLRKIIAITYLLT